MTNKKYPRGSEWRKWDLHIHTPASFHWSGQRFDTDYKSSDNIPLVDEMIHALNAAEPTVFALMDYWTFDGWFALKHRLSQSDAPELKKTVFPGIELRLMAPMNGRLNAHVLFSDQIDDQELIDFKSNLKIEFPGESERNLSSAALIQYARFVPADKLHHHGLIHSKVIADDVYALMAGSVMAELTCKSYKEAIITISNSQAIGFMPFDTSDGLTEIKRNENYAYTLGLFTSSPIFETRNQALWEAFSGVKTSKNGEWFDAFQVALNHTPRLSVSGSDAHCFVGEPGNDDRRGYGDYPSGKATWIKADPTFQGLLQAIKEPAKRSFIGKVPPKLKLYNETKSLFLDQLEIQKNTTSTITEHWLDGVKVELNPDLTAIIGNKGSGKSALADITALLGNSKQSYHFSFLKENRFRGRIGEPAKHFDAKAIWSDGASYSKNLNENPAIENVELVKYIPQGHFEALCNAHITGDSDDFEKELRSVIFSHADDAMRLGALDFDQLIEQQESSLRDRIDQFQGDMHKLNRQIVTVEDQMVPENRKTIEEKIVQKQRLLDEHDNVKPAEIAEPSGTLTTEQQSFSEKLSQIAQKLEEISLEKEKNLEESTVLAGKKKACSNIREQVQLLKNAIQQFKSEVKEDVDLIGLDLQGFLTVQINEQQISEIENSISGKKDSLIVMDEKSTAEKQKLIDEQKSLNALLNGPQQAYQKYLEDIKLWNDKYKQLKGSKDLPDTYIGLKNRCEQLDLLPEKRKELQQRRTEVASNIFDILTEQRENRELLFQPVQELIQNNSLIREGYKLQFKAELGCTADYISTQLFSIVKQNSGEFRGDSESLATIKLLTDQYDLNDKGGVLNFITELHDKLERAASGNVGITSLLRKGKLANDVYDFLFSLDFIQPRYTLLFQGAHIEQLSPGQRGSLLLIFYLLVDKGNSPIILDQPEENLDNETIVSLLVPVLTEAKKIRQIIMVTHNPNLAVVCDAEQIIYCEFDRKNNSKISYTSGSIECNTINKKIVDILEGTMPAFNNRRGKYF